METQKFVSLLNDTDNEPSKFETKKWYVINDQNNGEYGDGSENDSCIKFESLCDYSDAYVIMTGDIKVANIGTNTNVAIKNCAPFTRCVTHINDEQIYTAENLYFIMPMYNLLEYSDNYFDTSGSLYEFKRDEYPMNAGRPINFALDNSSPFKYKSGILGEATGGDGDDRSLKNGNIVVPLKYLSIFFRSLEMSLINFKINLELNWSINIV